MTRGFSVFDFGFSIRWNVQTRGKELVMKSSATRGVRRQFGEVYWRRGRWEWRLFDRPGGRVLAQGRAAGNFEANRALNVARRKAAARARSEERGGAYAERGTRSAERGARNAERTIVPSPKGRGSRRFLSLWERLGEGEPG